MLITRKKEALKLSAGYIQERGIVQQNIFEVNHDKPRILILKGYLPIFGHKGWVMRVKNMKGQTRENCA